MSFDQANQVGSGLLRNIRCKGCGFLAGPESRGFESSNLCMGCITACPKRAWNWITRFLHQKDLRVCGRCLRIRSLKMDFRAWHCPSQGKKVASWVCLECVHIGKRVTAEEMRARKVSRGKAVSTADGLAIALDVVVGGHSRKSVAARWGVSLGAVHYHVQRYNRGASRFDWDLGAARKALAARLALPKDEEPMGEIVTWK